MRDLPEAVMRLVDAALAEDIGDGDITTESLVDRTAAGRAVIIPREDCVVCGLDLAACVYEAIDPRIELRTLFEDGACVSRGQAIANVSGPLAPILTGERTVLNFLQRLCGIATAANRIRKKTAQKVVVLDSRKTVPGWRWLDKYAVRTGGCRNHRMGLYDGILIKDNHIACCGSIAEAVRRARERAPEGMAVEIEVEDMDGLKEALKSGVDLVMLDNFSPEQAKKAAALAGKGTAIEISGGIDEANIEQYLRSENVDFISMGALTHSVMAADIGMDVVVDRDKSKVESLLRIEC